MSIIILTMFVGLDLKDNFNIIFTYHEQENSLHLPTNDFIMDFFVMKLSSTFSCHYTRIQRRLD